MTVTTGRDQRPTEGTYRPEPVPPPVDEVPAHERPPGAGADHGGAELRKGGKEPPTTMQVRRWIKASNRPSSSTNKNDNVRRKRELVGTSCDQCAYASSSSSPFSSLARVGTATRKRILSSGAAWISQECSQAENEPRGSLTRHCAQLLLDASVQPW
jgi:hypothetical protein